MGIAEVIAALANMVTAICEGQPPEVKVKLWTWFVQDIARWRRVFHIPDDPVVTLNAPQIVIPPPPGTPK